MSQTAHEKALEAAEQAVRYYEKVTPDYLRNARQYAGDAIAAYNASIAEQGWKTVPLTPTVAMLKAADNSCAACLQDNCGCDFDEHTVRLWQAAFTAAPSPGEAP